MTGPRGTRSLIVVALLASFTPLSAQQTDASDRVFQTPEDVVERLYDLVTFGAGETPDWDEVASLFLDEAVIVLRTSRESLSVFSVDGFLADFVAFVERAGVRETGFSENVIKMKNTTIGDIAHVLVLYEASIPGSPRPAQQGVDSFQLIRQEGRWRLTSVVNEIPTSERPLPAELKVEG